MDRLHLRPGGLTLRVKAGGVAGDSPPTTGSSSESRQLLDPSRGFIQTDRCPERSFRPIVSIAEVIDNFVNRNDIPDIDLDV